MAFKLRSGNKTPFRAIGGDKETNAQYNTRVKAEFEEFKDKNKDYSKGDRRPVWKDGIVDSTLEAVDKYGYAIPGMGPWKPPVYKEEGGEMIKAITSPVKPKGDLRETTLEKVPSISMKNIDMGQVDELQPTKALPYELVKNNAKHFTTERVGQATHTYPKGDDGLALVRLKDQAGRVVFTGSQTEFTQKYGDVLKRGSKKYGQENREDRFYINR